MSFGALRRVGRWTVSLVGLPLLNSAETTVATGSPIQNALRSSGQQTAAGGVIGFTSTQLLSKEIGARSNSWGHVEGTKSPPQNRPSVETGSDLEVSGGRDRRRSGAARSIAVRICDSKAGERLFSAMSPAPESHFGLPNTVFL
jgi:hypothetical protein